MKDKKIIFVIGLVLISGIVSWTTYLKDYKQEDTVSIHTFPKEINGWVSEEMTITDVEYAILETRNAFVRKYTGPQGQEVYLFTVYSQNNRKVSHPPEVCYSGSGYQVSSNIIDTIPVPAKNMAITAHKLVLEHGEYKQIAYYWFKVGESFTPSYWKQQMLIAFKNLVGKPEGSALIRVSASVNGNEGKAVADIKEFTALMIPHIFEHLP